MKKSGVELQHEAGRARAEGHLSADVLLDANVLLEVELTEKHAEACKALLRIVERGELRAVIMDFHVDTIVVIMERYGAGWEEISRFLA
ncbi:MAG: hypothetical protein DRJ57_05535 [Thermoprotei archaeon]|nr:MAG: hypothetical protein DRJ57_05535 [Thermoprotei archaeon]